MKTIALTAIATWLIVPAGLALAATPAPTFQPLAGSKSAATANNGAVMRAPQAMRPPLVSETRAIPRPDGSLEIKCREVPNPRLRDADDRILPGPRR